MTKAEKIHERRPHETAVATQPKRIELQPAPTRTPTAFPTESTFPKSPAIREG
jgi:hypothetical protein